jgi:CubicO group peptidase (beta-lactamase class C family)
MTCPASLLAVALAGFLVPALGGSSPAFGWLDERGDDLVKAVDQSFTEYVKEGFSGVILLARHGKMIMHKAYSKDAVLTPENAFWIGSLSKTFTAVAILKLQEQGRLSVDEPITKYFADVPQDKQKITVGQLLTHTSGLPIKYAADRIADRNMAIHALLATPLVHAPGEKFQYSNDGFNLLAIIIEIASGQGYENYLRDQLLVPSGMKQSGFWGRPITPPEAALAPELQKPMGLVAAPNWARYVRRHAFQCAGEDCRGCQDETRQTVGGQAGQLNHGQENGSGVFLRREEAAWSAAAKGLFTKKAQFLQVHQS